MYQWPLTTTISCAPWIVCNTWNAPKAKRTGGPGKCWPVVSSCCAGFSNRLNKTNVPSKATHWRCKTRWHGPSNAGAVFLYHLCHRSPCQPYLFELGPYGSVYWCFRWCQFVGLDPVGETCFGKADPRLEPGDGYSDPC